jgi:hypothetical protein
LRRRTSGPGPNKKTPSVVGGAGGRCKSVSRHCVRNILHGPPKRGMEYWRPVITTWHMAALHTPAGAAGKEVIDTGMRSGAPDDRLRVYTIASN